MTLGLRLLGLAGAASAALLLCGFGKGVTFFSRSDGTTLRAAGRTDVDLGAMVAPAVDPKGRLVAYAKGSSGRYVSEQERLSLWAVELRRDTPPWQLAAAIQGGPLWSPDGDSVFFNVPAWVVSDAVHEVNVKTGAERFVIDGGVQGVIRTGRYRGMLLVSRHKYHPAPQFGSYDPVDVVRPDGKVILTVPGSETDEGEPSVAHWLKAHGWSAT